MKDGIKRYKSPDGSWRFKVNLQIEGVRIRKQNFFTQKEAQSYLGRMRMLVITGQYDAFVETEELKRQLADDVSFQEYATDVFTKKHCRDIRDSTKRRYWISMLQNVFPVVRLRRLRQMASNDFEQVFEEMMSQGYARTTVNFPISAMMYVLRRAKAEGKIEDIPNNPVSFKVEKRNIFLTDDELSAFLDAVKDIKSDKRWWLKVYVHLQLATFSRVGELLALNWTDIDFENKTIAINKQFDGVSLKMGNTKNNKIHTALPLSDDMIVLLKMFKLKCGACKMVFPNAHFFSKDERARGRNNPDTSRMRQTSVHRLLKILAEEAGMDPKRMSSHVLRKTAGDRLIRSGFTAHQVAHALRIDAKTVLWTYSTLDVDAFNEKLSAFTLLKTGNGVAMNDNEVVEGKGN